MFWLLRLLLVGLLILPVLTLAREDVVKSYRDILPLSSLLNHKIFYKHGKYITYAEEFYPEKHYPNTTIVDKKNRYIFIVDEGTGAGSSTIQFILLGKNAPNPYAIVVRSGYDTIAPTLTSQIELYEQNDGKWTQRETFFDELTILDFLVDDMTIGDAKYIISKLGATIYYKLPRVGEIVEAQLHFTYGFEQSCTGSNEQELDARAVKFFCNNIYHNKSIYRVIREKWNDDYGRFQLLDKIKDRHKTALGI